MFFALGAAVQPSQLNQGWYIWKRNWQGECRNCLMRTKKKKPNKQKKHPQTKPTPNSPPSLPFPHSTGTSGLISHNDHRCPMPRWLPSQLPRPGSCEGTCRWGVSFLAKEFAQLLLMSTWCAPVPNWNLLFRQNQKQKVLAPVLKQVCLKWEEALSLFFTPVSKQASVPAMFRHT